MVYVAGGIEVPSGVAADSRQAKIGVRSAMEETGERLDIIVFTTTCFLKEKTRFMRRRDRRRRRANLIIRAYGKIAKKIAKKATVGESEAG